MSVRDALGDIGHGSQVWAEIFFESDLGQEISAHAALSRNPARHGLRELGIA